MATAESTPTCIECNQPLVRHHYAQHADGTPGMECPTHGLRDSTTTHPLGGLTPIEQAAADRRAAYVAGLRELAAVLEAHVEIPIDGSDTLGPFYHGRHLFADQEACDAERFLAAARALDATIQTEKFVSDPVVDAVRNFGPIRYRVRVPAELVCEPVTVERTEHALPAALANLAEPGENPAGNWTLEQCGVPQPGSSS
jgi:hypothetical protein